MTSHEPLREKLHRHGQGHVLAFWDRIDVVGINAFHPLAERPGADLA